MNNFIILLIVAILLAKVPIINLPLVWFQTFFHELSHMLVALLTGGEVFSLKLFWTGAGVCRVRGGVFVLIFAAGYLGAPIWGGWLYNIGKDSTSRELALYKIRILMILLIMSTILWVRDGNTLLIIGFMLGILSLVALHIDSPDSRLFIRFCGIYVMLNAIHSPLYLYSHKIPWDDGVALAQLTDLPKFLFIALWCAFALIALISVVYVPWALGKEVS